MLLARHAKGARRPADEQQLLGLPRASTRASGAGANRRTRSCSCRGSREPPASCLPTRGCDCPRSAARADPERVANRTCSSEANPNRARETTRTRAIRRTRSCAPSRRSERARRPPRGACGSSKTSAKGVFASSEVPPHAWRRPVVIRRAADTSDGPSSGSPPTNGRRRSTSRGVAEGAALVRAS